MAEISFSDLFSAAKYDFSIVIVWGLCKALEARTLEDYSGVLSSYVYVARRLGQTLMSCIYCIMLGSNDTL